MPIINLSSDDISLEKILIAIFLFVIIWLIGNLLHLTIRKILSNKFSKHNAMISAHIIQYSFVIIGIYFLIYKALNLNLGSLAASFGIIAIAIAFSSQQIIQNLIAGILIAFQRPIKIGDWVDIGPGTGVSRVKDITLMRIILRDINGKIHYIANSSVLTSRMINYTESGFVEIPLQIAVPYNSNIEEIKKLLLEVVNKNNKILPNVSSAEKAEVRKTFHLPKIKELFAGTFDINLFKPKIYISSIAYPKIILEIRFWIREINKKDEIVSEFLDSLTSKLKETNMILS